MVIDENHPGIKLGFVNLGIFQILPDKESKGSGFSTPCCFKDTPCRFKEKTCCFLLLMKRYVLIKRSLLLYHDKVDGG